LVDDKPIGVALNRNLGNPAAPGEAVEAELNRLIERRSCQKDPDEASSELRAGGVGSRVYYAFSDSPTL
jgi:hypothetical protein